MRWLVLVAAAVLGCDGDPEVSSKLIEGAPTASNSLVSDHSDRIVVVGSNGGPRSHVLQHLANRVWQIADGEPSGFGYVMRGQDDEIYFLAANVYRLDDEEAFTWTNLGPLPAAFVGLPFAIDREHRFYTIVAPGIDMYAIAVARPGDADATIVPGSLPGPIDGAEAHVDDDGNIVWIAHDGSSIVRLVDGVQTKVMTCTSISVPGNCRGFSALGVEHDGSLLVAACGGGGGGGFMVRASPTGQQRSTFDCPGTDYFGNRLTVIPDGTAFLLTTDLNSTTGHLWRAGHGDDEWDSLGEASPGVSYYFRSSSSAYVFATGGAYSGVRDMQF